MHIKLLSQRDQSALDALLDSYGGAREISMQIDSLRDYKTRKKIADKLQGRKHPEDYKKRHSKIMKEWWTKRKQETIDVGI